MIRHALLLSGLVAFFLGCKNETPPAPSVQTAPAAAAPAPAAPAPAAAPPSTPAEVEMGGTYAAPAGTAGEPQIWVTTGDCFKPGWKSIMQAHAQPDGHWGTEVFVPQGTMLNLCGAMVEAGKPITVHGVGAGGPFRGQGIGEVEYKSIQITMAAGDAVQAPVMEPQTPNVAR